MEEWYTLAMCARREDGTVDVDVLTDAEIDIIWYGMPDNPFRGIAMTDDEIEALALEHHGDQYSWKRTLLSRPCTLVVPRSASEAPAQKAPRRAGNPATLVPGGNRKPAYDLFERKIEVALKDHGHTVENAPEALLKTVVGNRLKTMDQKTRKAIRARIRRRRSR
jgi:hypothetical protein